MTDAELAFEFARLVYERARDDIPDVSWVVTVGREPDRVQSQAGVFDRAPWVELDVTGGRSVLWTVIVLRERTRWPECIGSLVDLRPDWSPVIGF